MRIDLLMSTDAAVEQTGLTTKQAGGGRRPGVALEPEDTANFSGSDPVSSLSAQALQTAEARASKVQSLRAAVLGASYPVDPALLADAMINHSF